MRNARSLQDHESVIKKHRLSTSPPPPDSLFWRMWNGGGLAIAEKTLETPFLKGIKAGDLDPVTYGAFNVSDIFYCFKGAADYAIAAARTSHPVLKDYLEMKHARYEAYNRTACATWSLDGPGSVVPTPTARHYSELETTVANGTAMHGRAQDPIYAMIVMIPCEYLWAWLAAQLAPPKPGNIYAKWVTSNDSPDGAYAMGNFLQDYTSEHSIDDDVATSIYLDAMSFEYKNFLSVTS